MALCAWHDFISTGPDSCHNTLTAIWAVDCVILLLSSFGEPFFETHRCCGKQPCGWRHEKYMSLWANKFCCVRVCILQTFPVLKCCSNLLAQMFPFPVRLGLIFRDSDLSKHIMLGAHIVVRCVWWIAVSMLRRVTAVMFLTLTPGLDETKGVSVCFLSYFPSCSSCLSDRSSFLMQKLRRINSSVQYQNKMGGTAATKLF